MSWKSGGEERRGIAEEEESKVRVERRGGLDKQRCQYFSFIF